MAETMIKAEPVALNALAASLVGFVACVQLGRRCFGIGMIFIGLLFQPVTGCFVQFLGNGEKKTGFIFRHFSMHCCE
jgi:hypothetical protein